MRAIDLVLERGWRPLMQPLELAGDLPNGQVRVRGRMPATSVISRSSGTRRRGSSKQGRIGRCSVTGHLTARRRRSGVQSRDCAAGAPGDINPGMVWSHAADGRRH